MKRIVLGIVVLFLLIMPCAGFALACAWFVVVSPWMKENIPDLIKTIKEEPNN